MYTASASFFLRLCKDAILRCQRVVIDVRVTMTSLLPVFPAFQMARHVFQYEKMDSELGMYFGDPAALPPLRPTEEQQAAAGTNGTGGVELRRCDWCVACSCELLRVVCAVHALLRFLVVRDGCWCGIRLHAGVSCQSLFRLASVHAIFIFCYFPPCDAYIVVTAVLLWQARSCVPRERTRRASH
jgi:hypothetical protein